MAIIFVLVLRLIFFISLSIYLSPQKCPGDKVQLVACLTDEPEVVGSIPGQAHTFMEVDHLLISSHFPPLTD